MWSVLSGSSTVCTAHEFFGIIAYKHTHTDIEIEFHVCIYIYTQWVILNSFSQETESAYRRGSTMMFHVSVCVTFLKKTRIESTPKNNKKKKKLRLYTWPLKHGIGRLAYVWYEFHTMKLYSVLCAVCHSGPTSLHTTQYPHEESQKVLLKLVESNERHVNAN